jgi:TonB family protein
MSAWGADNLVALAVQAGVLALVGAPLPRLLGVGSPRARLVYWRGILLACLLLPFVQPWVPRPLSAAAAPAFSEQATAVAGTLSEEVRAGRGFPVPRVGLAEVVVAGMAVRAAWFAFGLFTLARLRRRTVRLDPRPGSVVDAIGLARADAEFRITATTSRPVTFGLVHPVVVVPGDFPRFAEDEQKAIACHELIHVRRHDWVRNLGDEVVRAVAWFHPAAWWLTRQIRLAREQVVDQEVVRRLGSRKPYLDVLLRLASPERGSLLVPAPLFLGRSHLSDRVALLLKEVRMSRLRLVLSFVAMAAILLLAGGAVVRAVPLHADAADQVAVAGQQPSKTTPVTPAKPGVSAAGQQKPTAPAAKERTVTKTKDVRPAFPTGSAPTPVIVTGRVTTSGAVTGTVCETGPANLCEIAMAAVGQWRFSPGAGTALLVGFNPAAGTELRDQPPVLVGGNVKAPVKVEDVKPIYPSDASAAGVQGVVILESRIASDGTVSDARILRSVPMLDKAALTAVLGWKFNPPGLPLQMTVTVNFVLSDGPGKGVGVGTGAGGGIGGGVAGGVGGGVSGGVSGGVAGGVADSAKPTWITLSTGERALKVGGAAKPPRKVVDVKPVYPKDAQDARVEGVVILDTVIGPDGKVKDARILRSVPMLDQAALDAVRQWEFSPTLLNGAPITVVMTVTVNFTLQ